MDFTVMQNIYIAILGKVLCSVNLPRVDADASYIKPWLLSQIQNIIPLDILLMLLYDD